MGIAELEEIFNADNDYDVRKYMGKNRLDPADLLPSGQEEELIKHRNRLFILSLVLIFTIVGIFGVMIIFFVDQNYVKERLQKQGTVFVNLIKKGDLIRDLSEYPVAIQMCFYKKWDFDMSDLDKLNTERNWRATFPGSYPSPNYYICLRGLARFFDKLRAEIDGE